jgi:hypothetical protein
MSRHVAGLERTVGVHLVDRAARTISLTEADTRYAEPPGDEPPFPDDRGFAKVDPAATGR